MSLIRDLAQQALATGYLTIAAENQLRKLLKTKYGMEDFYAFMNLQAAAMSGQVKQESRELRRSQHSLSRTNKQYANR